MTLVENFEWITPAGFYLIEVTPWHKVHPITRGWFWCEGFYTPFDRIYQPYQIYILGVGCAFFSGQQKDCKSML